MERRAVQYCTNCGGYGHYKRKCRSPLTSYGVILYTLVDDQPLYLMIQRKFTPCYVELIRGKYHQQPLNYLKMLIEGLSYNERRSLVTLTFEELWDRLWSPNENENPTRTRHFYEAKKLFQDLVIGYTRDEVFLSLDGLLDAIPITYHEPEWGFPKGRREHQERDIECAIREFQEETGILQNQYQIISRSRPYVENFAGTNEVLYRHIYYLGFSPKYFPVWIDPTNPTVIAEIQKLGWFTKDECLSMIRPYHQAKKDMFQQIHEDITLITKNSIQNDSQI